MCRLLWALAFACVTSLAGCGGGGATGGVAVYEVSGTVTLFGNPLPNASIFFAPTGEGQPTARGKTEEDGTFVLSTYDYGDGAAEGNFKVVITKPVWMQAETSSSDEEAGGHEAAEGDASAAHAKDSKSSAETNDVPEIYTSSKTTTLTADVKKDGENVFTFPLE